MNELISITNELLLHEVKNQISDTSVFETLQLKLDEAEKFREVPFANFFGCGNDSVLFIQAGSLK